MKKFEEPTIEVMTLVLESVTAGDFIEGKLSLGDNTEGWS